MEVPFIVASWDDELETLRNSFADGAIDYLVKPFTRNELLAKIERHLRLARVARERASPSPEVHLDPLSLTLKRRGEVVASFTPKEIQIFSLLYGASGSTLNRSEILRQVWGRVNVSEKAFDVHLVNIRRKIAPAGLEVRYQDSGDYQLISMQPIQT